MESKTLKQLRKEAGVTQKELATLMEITVGMVSLIEQGKRGLSLERADVLAQRYGMPLEKILHAYKVNNMLTGRPKAG